MIPHSAEPREDPTVVAEALRRSRAKIAHPRPFVLDVTLGPEDLSDVVPHLNNVRALHWVDRAAEAHAESAGWSRQRLLDAGLMWFVARHELDYLAECGPGEHLMIYTWIRLPSRGAANSPGNGAATDDDSANARDGRAGRLVRTWRDTVIVRADVDERPVALRAATLWVLVDLSTRRACRIPESMLAALDPIGDPSQRELGEPGETGETREDDRRCEPR